MSLFKCKMCGGDLEIAEGASIAECEYCGTKQTVPKSMDENLQNLFNRANTLRIKSEFDKAEKLYEKLIQADSTQSEAYWGLILCKYGIEYVDDPTTFKKIPTCHRTSYDSIIADADYKSALENADMSQRTIYEEQAKEIDRIQKDILTLAQKEETYDVFICYKETDTDGRRTQDSVIANDIYYQLTQEGFKVFYAAITLEGKLGSAYEPIIFAALNSAKVMLTIGTKSEYFNAVWVKNEWSRYLKIIKSDRSKLLIPCYRDMDAYELPEEFAHLQAQDMSKIGFINDIVRGIKKVIVKDEPRATVVKETVVTNTNTNTAPLLERVLMFLEDGDWGSADEYCEKVLDLEPKNAQAYLGKLMAELKVHCKEDLESLNQSFDNSDNYNKIMRFGNKELIAELKQCNTIIRNRNEENRKASIYNTAENLATQQAPEAQLEAAKEFDKIPGYRDADEKAKECRHQATLLTYNNAIRAAENATTSKQFSEAAKLFFDIVDYPPAKQKAEECIAKSKELAENERQNDIYQAACTLMSNGYIPTVERAIRQFQTIITWRDSEKKIEECYKKIAEIKAENELIRLANEQAKKRKTRILIIALVSIILIIGLTTWATSAIRKHSYYKNGEYGKLVNEFGITDIVIPEGVTVIKPWAFSSATNLKSVTIPDSVTSIDNGAFDGCSNLTSITIPESVTSIGDYAFKDCSALTSVNIPDSVTSIGRGAFNGCSNLTSITLPFVGANRYDTYDPSLGYIFGLATSTNSNNYVPNSLKTVVITGGTSIADYAFYGCDSLTSVTIPDSVTSIGYWAFKDCSNLTSVTIGNSVTSIGSYAFSDCSSLTSITIPHSVTSIDDAAFFDCSSLKSIKFEGTVLRWKAIKLGAFWSRDIPATKVICSNGAVTLN